MKKLLTILFTLFLSISIISFLNINKVYAKSWGQDDGPSDWECSDIDDAIDYYRDQASRAGSPREEDDWLDLADRAKEWKENNCDDDSCSVGNGFSRNSLIVGGSVVHDYHGFEVCRRSKAGVGTVFCIDPDKRSTLCQTGSGSWSNSNEPLAQIFAAYQQSSETDEDYLAAQILIWEVVGYSGVVPGYSASWARNKLFPKLWNSNQWQHEDVDFNKDVVDVSIGDTINVEILNPTYSQVSILLS